MVAIIIGPYPYGEALAEGFNNHICPVTLDLSLEATKREFYSWPSVLDDLLVYYDMAFPRLWIESNLDTLDMFSRAFDAQMRSLQFVYLWIEPDSYITWTDLGVPTEVGQRYRVLGDLLQARKIRVEPMLKYGPDTCKNIYRQIPMLDGSEYEL